MELESFMEMDNSETGFITREEAARFVQETAAREKRPYRVTRSDRSRFCVACVDAKCNFQVRFWRRRDGKFHIIRNVAHSCTLFQTTVTHPPEPAESIFHDAKKFRDEPFI